MSLFLFITVFITILNKAEAYGMASSYLLDKTMYLYPGESAEYKVELQNNEENEIRIIFNLESEIAQVIDNREFYIVGDNIRTVPIAISIKMPEKSSKVDERRYNGSIALVA